MVFLNGGNVSSVDATPTPYSLFYIVFMKIIHSGTPYEDFHGVPLTYHANAPHSRVSDILSKRGFDQLG